MKFTKEEIDNMITVIEDRQDDFGNIHEEDKVDYYDHADFDKGFEDTLTILHELKKTKGEWLIWIKNNY